MLLFDPFSDIVSIAKSLLGADVGAGRVPRFLPMDLYRVNDVGVKQNPFERIVGIGDIYVSSADSSTPHKFLHNIGDPVRVKDIIRELARIERHKRRVLLREDVGIDEF